MKPNEVRNIVAIINNMFNKKVKLEILNTKKDGSFTVKMVHGARVLNVEKNFLGEYFIKFYPFLDMSENHNWAVRNSKYATFLTPTCIRITNLPCFGKQSPEYAAHFGDYVNTKDTIGVFILADLSVKDVTTLLALTVLAHREQIEERTKMARAQKKTVKDDAALKLLLLLYGNGGKPKFN